MASAAHHVRSDGRHRGGLLVTPGHVPGPKRRRVNMDDHRGSIVKPKDGIAPWIAKPAGSRPELPLFPPGDPRVDIRRYGAHR